MLFEILLFILFFASIAALSYENQAKFDTAYRKTIDILKNKLNLDVPEDKIKITGVTPEEYKEHKDAYKLCVGSNEKELIELGEFLQNLRIKTISSGFTQYLSDGRYEVVVPVKDQDTEGKLVSVLSHEIGGHVFQKTYGNIGKDKNQTLFEAAKVRKEMEDLTKEHMKNKIINAEISDENDAEYKFRIYCIELGKKIGADESEKILNDPLEKKKFFDKYLEEQFNQISAMPEGTVPVNLTIEAINEKRDDRYLETKNLKIKTEVDARIKHIGELVDVFEKHNDTADDNDTVLNAMNYAKFIGDKEKCSYEEAIAYIQSTIAKKEGIKPKAVHLEDSNSKYDITDPKYNAKHIGEFLKMKAKEEERKMAKEDIDNLEDESLVIRNAVTNTLIPLEQKYQGLLSKMKKFKQTGKLEEGWSRSVEIKASEEYAKSKYGDGTDKFKAFMAEIKKEYNNEIEANNKTPGSSIGKYAKGNELYIMVSGDDFEKKKQIAMNLTSDTDLEKEAKKMQGGTISGFVKSIKSKVFG